MEFQIASGLDVNCQLSQAILQFHAERTLNEWTPIARFESHCQHNERRVCED